MAYETAYNQVHRQMNIFEGAQETIPITRAATGEIVGHTSVPMRTPPGTVNQHPIKRGSEVIGHFDFHNNKTLNTDKFTIPERPKPQGEQLALEGHPSLQPIDEDLHKLRQQNPKLNDYQFKLYTSHSSDDNQVTINHAPFTTATPGGRKARQRSIDYDVATLDWNNNPYHEEHLSRDGVDYGGVHMIKVEPSHRGKGLAEAAWDYANMKHARGETRTAPLHSTNRSMAGDIFAKRVGGPRLLRTAGQDIHEY